MPILAPGHDYAHPVESDTAWSESYYFNAYDPASDSGFFASALPPDSIVMMRPTSWSTALLSLAAEVLDGIAAERFLILPHPVVAEYEQRRAGDRERWLRGMRRIQAQIADAMK